MRRALLPISLACALALAPASPSRASAVRSAALAKLVRVLARDASAAGRAAGAYVIDTTTGQPLFAARPGAPRTLASNTKLFTSAAVLARYGPSATLATAVLGTGSLSQSGVFNGNLYLRGGGDPTFGSRVFAQSQYGSGASVEALAAILHSAGVRSISGAVVGDESLFDSLRIDPRISAGESMAYVGPLSALDFDRGLANPQGSAFESNPPLFAASRLVRALDQDGIHVAHGSTMGRTPAGAYELAEVRSPPIARLLQLMDKASDNFFAEMLVKGLPVDTLPGAPLRQPSDPLPVPPAPGGPGGTLVPPQLSVVGTTSSGAGDMMSFARSLGVKALLVDGSGLSLADRASPRAVASLLARMRTRTTFQAFYGALAIAGRDGTLASRMRSGPARGNCHGKTGTLTGLSALSGYCRARNAHTLVFSILMNGVVDGASAEALEDAMAEAIAGYR